LDIPLLVKLSFKPEKFTLGAYTGVYYIVPLGGAEAYSVPLGISAGADAGIRLGPGILFLDLNFSADLGEGAFTAPGIRDIHYTRKSFGLSLGYSYGLGKR
jgi:hypothetical protein